MAVAWVCGCGTAEWTARDELRLEREGDDDRTILGLSPESEPDTGTESAAGVGDTAPPLDGGSDTPSSSSPDGNDLDGSGSTVDSDQTAEGSGDDVAEDPSTGGENEAAVALAGTGAIRLFWDQHAPEQHGESMEVHAAHPQLDGVLIRTFWARIEPERGHFDFSELDADVAWWAQRGKKVIIRNGFYVPGVQEEVVPEWLYEHGVETITFQPRPEADPVRFPIVWDSPEFLLILDEYAVALAEHYDGDPRIESVWIGIGHLGYTTVNGSPGATIAFPQAGWTPELWEGYIESVIDVYTAAFAQTPALFAVSPVWLQDFMFEDLAEPMTRLTEYAVAHGTSLFLNGFDPSADQYVKTPFPAMIDTMTRLALPAGFSLMVGDDGPLWVDEQRRMDNAHEADRDDAGFRAVLDTALAEWNRLQQRGDLVLVLLEPEMSATNPNDPSYRPDVEAILSDFLNTP